MTAVRTRLQVLGVYNPSVSFADSSPYTREPFLCKICARSFYERHGLHPQGVRRIRKAAKPPTAAQPRPALQVSQ